jgi:carboxymethylenebutenolidase
MNAKSAPTRREITLDAPDGRCRTFEFRPAGTPPWPAVLVFMDGIGIRPAILGLAERLATYGYLVLLPDLFYRSGSYAPMNAKTVFTDPEQRKVLMEKFIGLAPLPKIVADTAVFLDYLERHPEARPGGVGTTGYCMGGGASLAAAGTYPDRIKVAASFHGGQLATDAPESPHRLADQIKAKVYVAGAIEDSSFPDDMKARLNDALSAAGVDYQLETYRARHGWVLEDTPSYDPAAAERHWKALTTVLDSGLRAGS